MRKMPTDKERIDFLQSITDNGTYTGKVIMRNSNFGRGWRLHETSKQNSFSDVRSAIDFYMDEFKKQNKVTFIQCDNADPMRE
jgi:hypothetical protein